MAQVTFQADEMPQAFAFAQEQAYWRGFVAGVKSAAEHSVSIAHQKIMDSLKPENPEPKSPPPEPPKAKAPHT